MSQTFYNWQRFWYPRGDTIYLSDGGYLPDPEHPTLTSTPSRPVESLASIPCLILLGEPGMGKSQTLAQAYNGIQTSLSTQGTQTFYLNLRSYGNEERIYKALFESPTFLEWQAGSHRLHLFLDSLDEALLRIDTLATLLLDELTRYPIERLSLCIACRTASWPHGLEEGLRRLWGDGAVSAYELAPLRRRDVYEAARAESIDPDEFTTLIRQREAVPLAIKPITLKFLLAIFKSTRDLPRRQIDLYEKGCRLLCEEPNENRRDAGYYGALDPDERMELAGRIAAVMLFTNRDAVWTGLEQGDVPAEDVLMREFLLRDGTRPPAPGGEDALRETLGCGLFSSRGPHRLGWAHQTFAEYLAAWYLMRQKVAPSKLLSLLIHSGDAEQRLVPQLHQVAAWLANLSPELFSAIMKVDPLVLPTSDIATADAETRRTLVDNLLRLFETEQARDDQKGWYPKLDHPGLAEQLRPYITDSQQGWLVRRVAIDIAEACRLQALQEDIAQVALDEREEHHTRVNAAYAVGRIGDRATRARLRPLALGQAGPDPDDELRGCGLRATWPDHLTATEVFEILDRERQGILLGAYEYFVNYQFIEALSLDDLPLALQWVSRQPKHRPALDDKERSINAILLWAWGCLDHPGVLDAFAQAVWGRLKRHDPWLKWQDGDSSLSPNLSEPPSLKSEQRYRLVEELLPLAARSDKWVWLLVARPLLITSQDIPWFLNHLMELSSLPIQQVCVNLISRLFNREDVRQQELVFDACQANTLLAQEFAWLLRPITLDSPEANRLKEEYKKWQELTAPPEVPLLDPSPLERVQQGLDRFEEGDAEAWWQLNREMTLEPDSTHYHHQVEADLTTLPVWHIADPLTRSRIVDAARQYLFTGNPRPAEWLGTNTFYLPAAAGYRALFLLRQIEPAFFQSLPQTIWQKWAPIILAYPTSSGIGDEVPYQALVRLAYDHAPSEIIQTLLLLIERDNEQHGTIFATAKVEPCWDARLAEALLAKAQEATLAPKSIGKLLSDLLTHESLGAQALTESLLPLPPPATGVERERAIVAGHVLMTVGASGSWGYVWSAVQSDSEFGRAVLEEVSHQGSYGRGVVLERLSEDELADLFSWLERHYPDYANLHGGMAHLVSPPESAAHWKQDVLTHLKMRGTPQACYAIRRLMIENPSLDWLRWTLMEAQQVTRFQTWSPLAPADLVRLIHHPQTRLVQNGEHLLDLVTESLNRLEAKLQGETPAAIDLWNELEDGTYRPRDENRLSDYIKRHLEQDLCDRGIVVGRELEIRRGEGDSVGERTDLHVDAIAFSAGKNFDIITVIIETKGCWHKELQTAMETQLLNRYLLDNRCQHGLYLVGWFNCPQWRSDANQRRASKLGIDKGALQTFLEAQAAALSIGAISLRSYVLNAALR